VHVHFYPLLTRAGAKLARSFRLPPEPTPATGNAAMTGLTSAAPAMPSRLQGLRKPFGIGFVVGLLLCVGTTGPIRERLSIVGGAGPVRDLTGERDGVEPLLRLPYQPGRPPIGWIDTRRLNDVIPTYAAGVVTPDVLHDARGS
jgi:hypothetical protein